MLFWIIGVSLAFGTIMGLREVALNTPGDVIPRGAWLVGLVTFWWFATLLFAGLMLAWGIGTLWWLGIVGVL